MKFNFNRLRIRSISFGAAIFCLIVAAHYQAMAATQTVTAVGDTQIGAAGCADGCSLREAIAAAGNGDTIAFASPLFNSAQTITLGETEILINKSLTVNGTGANLLTISANNLSCVLTAFWSFQTTF